MKDRGRQSGGKEEGQVVDSEAGRGVGISRSVAGTKPGHVENLKPRRKELCPVRWGIVRLPLSPRETPVLVTSVLEWQCREVEREASRPRRAHGPPPPLEKEASLSYQLSDFSGHRERSRLEIAF